MAKQKLISTKMKVFMLCLFAGSIISFSAAGVLLYNSDFTLANYFDVNDWNLSFFSNSSRLQGHESYLTNQDLNEIENLSIDFNGYNVYFETYEGNTLDLYLYDNFNRRSNSRNVTSSNTVESPFSISREGNKLTVKPNTNLLTELASHYEFMIKIPYSYSKTLNINSSSGEMNLDNLKLSNINLKAINSTINLNSVSCESANISLTNGNIHGDSFSSKNLVASTVNGNLYFSPLSGEVKLTTVNGNIHSTITSYLTNLDINTTSGYVNLNIPDEGDFSFNYSTMNGEFLSELNNPNGSYLDIPTKVQGSTEFSTGNGTNKINVKTVSGNFKIYN